jgi:methionine-rich copper-binding protein CopC
MTSSSFRLTVVLLLAAATFPRAAFAHAIVLESRPAPNATVAGPDVPLELRFNSRIDRKRSRVTVAGSEGEAHAVPLAETDRPDRLEATLGGLGPGDYKVKWQVLSVDGHITRGEIPFHVGSR